MWYKSIVLGIALLAGMQAGLAQKSFTGTIKYSIDYSLDDEKNGHTDLTFHVTKKNVAIEFTSDGEYARLVHGFGSNKMYILTGGIGISASIQDPGIDTDLPALEWEKLMRTVTRTDADAEFMKRECSYVIFEGDLDRTELCVDDLFALPVGHLFEGGAAAKSQLDKTLEKAFSTNALFYAGEILIKETGQKAVIELSEISTEPPSESLFSTQGYQMFDFDR